VQRAWQLRNILALSLTDPSARRRTLARVRDIYREHGLRALLKTIIGGRQHGH